MNTDEPAKTTKDIPLVMPTVQDIAMIAATLARNSKQQGPDTLADAALKLYIACDLAVCGLQFDKRKQDSDFIRANFHFEDKDLPVTRDKFFQRMLPQYKDRADELARIAKYFLKDRLRHRNNREPTLEEVADTYGRFGPFDKFTEAAAMAYEFHEWHKRDISETRRAAGKESAAKKAAEREAKTKLKKKL
jgi:hypothetical protein